MPLPFFVELNSKSISLIVLASDFDKQKAEIVPPTTFI